MALNSLTFIHDSWFLVSTTSGWIVGNFLLRGKCIVCQPASRGCDGYSSGFDGWYTGVELDSIAEDCCWGHEVFLWPSLPHDLQK